MHNLTQFTEADFAGYNVPSHNHEGLLNWVNHGIPAGSFIMAVLSNDLRETFGRADHINRHCVPEIVGWLFNVAPSACWGSPECVREWRAMHQRSRDEASTAPVEASNA